MSKIPWCDETWNPTTGCTPISEGCLNCYAARMAKRLAGRYGYPGVPNEFEVTYHPAKVQKPSKWLKPKRIFVCSMGDLFHSSVEWNWQYKILEMAMMWNYHTFMLLTKRPHKMAEVLNSVSFQLSRNYQGRLLPLDNLWLGVTAENQKRYDERWTIASQIPAAVKFVSIEPALEYVNIDTFPPYPDWVIWGPETGPGKRPFKAWWAEETYELCQLKGIPFFDKRKDYLAREFPK